MIEQHMRCFWKVVAIKINELYLFLRVNIEQFKRNAYKIIIKTNFNLKYNVRFLIFKSINF